MLTAFAFSTLFLISYITNHWLHGDMRFPGPHNAIWVAYIVILISHITLSVIALPLVLITLFLALTRRFATLAQYSAETGQDRHSVLLDYDVFMHVPMLDARDMKTVQKIYDARDLDFRLKPGSAAVDRGAVIANVTDGFTGSAPDLGALESGVPLPHYGPRQ